MYLINEVSRIVDLSQKRVREYEKEGFIKPMREKNTNNRRYTDFDIGQIRRIKYLIHKQGFTVSSLRSLMVMAPCWNIFDCDKKEICPVYQDPMENCYVVRATKGAECGGPCTQCAIYLCRSAEKIKLLNKVDFPL